MADKPRTPDPAAWREGHRRALAMLRDVANTSLDETDQSDDSREGRPQANVVHGHLFALISTRNKDVVEAFSSVLTQYLAHDCGSDEDALNWLDEATREPIRTRMAGLSADIAIKPFGNVRDQFRVTASA